MALNRSFLGCAVAIPAAVIAVDQFTKKWATQLFGQPFNICELDPFVGNKGHFHDFSPVVDWALTCNLGFSFGLGSTDTAAGRWGLTIFAFLMALVMMVVLYKSKEKWTKVGLGFIIGGAIGNGIDRFLHGAVTDFISVGDLLPFFPWVFNVADMAINVGVAFIILDIFLDWRREKAAKKAAEN